VTRVAAVAALALALALAACAQPEASLGDHFREVVDVPPQPIGALDVLLVVDSSGSMKAKQDELVAAAGDALFGQLTADLGRLPDLHVGVVTTDLGAGDNNIQFCAPPGDDAILQPGAPGATCPVDGRFLVDVASADGTRLTNYTGTLADAFACVATVGTGGCGFEQPLEAMRLALDGSRAQNDGFLRDYAMLLVLFVSDEDDCSVADPSLFDPSAQLGPLAFRCFPSGVVCDPDRPDQPGVKTGCRPRDDSAWSTRVADYVDFLRGLKSDPSMVMVGGLFAPPDPVDVELDGDGQLAVTPACTDPLVTAEPAIRLGALAAAFPSRYAFAPVCGAASTDQLRGLTRTVDGVLGARPCLLGPVPPGATCRAFATGAGVRVPIPACATETSTDCFRIKPDSVACGYTPSQLAVGVNGNAVPQGRHLIVECAVADGL
jgi:hypothetical protein